MAVAATNLTTARSNTDLTAYATAAVTPTADRLVLAAVRNQASSGTANTPTLTGNNLTWVQVATQQTGVHRLTVFRAMGAAPTLGVIAIDLALQTQVCCEWSIAEFSGIDTSGTDGSGAVVQSVVNSATATSLTVTLAAFGDTGNATYGVFGHAANEDTTEGTGFSRVGETRGGSPNSGILAEFRADNDTTVDASWATSAICRGIAVEIKAATGGTAQALAGTSAGSSTTTGALSVDWPLAGTSSGASTDTAALVVDRPLAGTTAGSSLDTGDLTAAWALAGQSDGTSTDTGDLTALRLLAGESAGGSDDTATLGLLLPLAGQSDGGSADTATVGLLIALAGTSSGGSSDTATLALTVGLAGVSVGVSTDAGALALAVSLAGISAGTSSDTGTLGLPLGVVAGYSSRRPHGHALQTAAGHAAPRFS